MRQRGPKIMLRDKLVAYFAANPEDELTLADISVKFNAPPLTARDSVVNLRKAGLLATRRSPRGAGAPIIISIGPSLASVIGRTT